jgi:hypothetical protein
MGMSAGENQASAGRPSSTESPRLSDEEITVARFASAGLGAIAGILAIWSVFTVWWYSSGGSTATTTQLFPDFYLKQGGSVVKYAAVGLGPVGGLFDAVFALAVVGGIVLLAGSALTLADAVRRRPAKGRMNVGLALAGTVIMAVAWVAAPSMLPWAFGRSASSYCAGWTGNSPCHIPWGPGSQAAVSYTFFMADGWIIMLGALTVATIGLVIGHLGKNTA